MIDLTGRTALVTGASSGIGREFARALAPEVGALLLVARRKERLDELAHELTTRHKELRVRVRPADLSSREATSDLLDELEEEDVAIDVLINNAGLADYGPFVQRGWERMLETLEVNVTAFTQLLQRLVPPMVERGFGAVLNVGSSAGSLATPSLSVYAATKAYVNSLSEALSAELHDSGVQVTVVCPGPVDTEFQVKSGSTRRPPLPRAFYVDPEQVAKEALEGLKSGQTRVVPGAPMHAAMLAAEAAPKALLRPFLKRVAKRFRD
jgi:short-subunit dehydrogenase